MRFLLALSYCFLSLLGVLLVGALALLGGVPIAPSSLETLAAKGHPGVLAVIVLLPAFVVGLILAAVLFRRRRRQHGQRRGLPVIDLNHHRTRRALVGLVTMLTLCGVVGGVASLEVLEYTESNAFCGEMCHSVMTPEYTTFQQSPHSGLHCVQCHVGPGVGGFLKAKLNGTVQLAEVMFGNFQSPIPTPVHDLPDTSGTCLTCHAAEAFHGERPKVVTRFAEDEANTSTKTILLLDVGGYNLAKFEGIHWHVDPDVQIRYRSDDRRENIYEVEMTGADGTVKTFRDPGAGDDGSGHWRTMDCTDCHNRPTHKYYEAAEAVDLMLERGLVADDLPYLKREAMRALKADYATHDEARAAIADHIGSFYRTEYESIAAARAPAIEEAGAVLGSVYASNVFPTMNIDWGTYPDHRGHEQSPGCFRCHAGNQVTEIGESISVDCRICHAILAWDEASPEMLELIEARERSGK